MSDIDGDSTPIQIQDADILTPAAPTHEPVLAAGSTSSQEAEKPAGSRVVVVASTTDGNVTVAAEVDERLGLHDADGTGGTIAGLHADLEGEEDSSRDLGKDDSEKGDLTTIINEDEEPDDESGDITAAAISPPLPTKLDDPITFSEHTKPAADYDYSRVHEAESDSPLTSVAHLDASGLSNDAAQVATDSASAIPAQARPAATKKFTSSLSMNKKFLEKYVPMICMIQHFHL